MRLEVVYGAMRAHEREVFYNTLAVSPACLHWSSFTSDVRQLSPFWKSMQFELVVQPNGKIGSFEVGFLGQRPSFGAASTHKVHSALENGWLPQERDAWDAGRLDN